MAIVCLLVYSFTFNYDLILLSMILFFIIEVVYAAHAYLQYRRIPKQHLKYSLCYGNCQYRMDWKKDEQEWLLSSKKSSSEEERAVIR